MVGRRSSTQAGELLTYLSSLARKEVRSTYLKQNLGLIASNIALSCSSLVGVKLEALYFEGDEWKGSKLNKATFDNCAFLEIVLNDCAWVDCHFIGCQIEGLTYNDTTRFDNSVFDDGCHVLGILRDENNITSFRTYIPRECQDIIESLGAHFPSKQLPRSIQVGPVRNDLRSCLEAFLRIFSRNTGATQNLIDMKLGTRAPLFQNSVLPVLIEYGLVRKTEYRGRGHQNRYELAYPVDQILKAENREATVSSNLVGFWDKLRD